jgi:hypothetical protein
VVTGAYHERGESSGKRYEYHDRLTDVWINVGNTWKVIASHYSVPMKWRARGCARTTRRRGSGRAIYPTTRRDLPDGPEFSIIPA